MDRAKINSNTSINLFITLEAVVKISYLSEKDFKRPEELRVFYNTLDLSEAKDYQYFFTDSILILIAWLILPFIIAGIVVFYLLRYCVRRIMVMRGNLVEEVEIVANPTVPSSSKLAAGAAPAIVHPDSAKTQIK